MLFSALQALNPKLNLGTWLWGNGLIRDEDQLHMIITRYLIYSKPLFH